MEFKQNLNKFFRELRKNGYTARQNYWCCRSCGWAALSDEEAKKAVFYSKQNSVEEGKQVYLSWSGDGTEICNIAEKFGFITAWNGSEDNTIRLINPDVLE